MLRICYDVVLGPETLLIGNIPVLYEAGIWPHCFIWREENKLCISGAFFGGVVAAGIARLGVVPRTSNLAVGKKGEVVKPGEEGVDGCRGIRRFGLVEPHTIDTDWGWY
jgi:hypothetical protein